MRRLLLIAAACASVAACNLNTTEVADNPSDPTTETFDPSLHVNIATMSKTAHGVFYRDTIVGTGAVLSGTPVVVITYAAFTKTGALFASGQAEPLSLAVLPFGMQEGMQGMREGGERLMVIPSELGYANAIGAPVPPNSTLVFDVLLNQLP